MNECVVTKFNGQLDSQDNPLYFGKLEFVKVGSGHPSWPYDFQIGASAPVSLSSKNLDAVNISGIGDVSLPYEISSFASDGMRGIAWDGIGKSLFVDKYDKDIQRLLVLSNPTTVDYRGHLSDFMFLTSLIRLNLNNTSVDGELEDLAGLTLLSNLSLSNTSVRGDIGSLSTHIPLTYFTVQDTDIGGDISDIGNLININNFVVLRSKVTGSIEDFVEGQILNGRSNVTTSSPILSLGVLCTLSFGGVIQTQDEGNCCITWDSASKIAVYYGSSSIASCSRVYAKGATSEEIAAWEQEGKTVIVVD